MLKLPSAFLNQLLFGPHAAAGPKVAAGPANPAEWGAGHEGDFRETGCQGFFRTRRFGVHPSAPALQLADHERKKICRDGHVLVERERRLAVRGGAAVGLGAHQRC